MTIRRAIELVFLVVVADRARRVRRARADHAAVGAARVPGERTVSGLSAVRNASGVSVIDVTLERIVRENLDGNLYHYAEFVDATRMADPAYADALHAMLRSKYIGSRLDLIFVMGDLAYSFVSRYRASFFPETPVVFSTSRPRTGHVQLHGHPDARQHQGYPGHGALR